MVLHDAGGTDLYGVIYPVVIGGQHFDCKASRSDSAEKAARITSACAGLKKL